MSTLPVLVFDVNETLLDLDALAPHFERIFGRSTVLREWFAQLILYSEAITLTGNYVPFGELGGAVLRMIGATEGIHIPDRETQMVKEAIATLPPHAEVPEALARLRSAGFGMFTLTNNPRATCEKQLRHAGIGHLFDGQFSVDDEVHRYKPAREVYRAVEEAVGVPTSQLWLVACHTWDVLGASAAGWNTALILRPGNAPLGVGGQPLITGDDLGEVADEILKRYLG
ncbi:MAG: haloacid dehalogenase type II [Steroidobacteraceae bacterium]